MMAKGLDATIIRVFAQHLFTGRLADLLSRDRISKVMPNDRSYLIWVPVPNKVNSLRKTQVCEFARNRGEQKCSRAHCLEGPQIGVFEEIIPRDVHNHARLLVGACRFLLRIAPRRVIHPKRPRKLRQEKLPRSIQGAPDLSNP